MNRAQAADKIRKLRALGDPARGGTPAERATANHKADQLAARFNISAVETAEQPRTRRRPHTGSPFETSDFVADLRGRVERSEFYFNVMTGEHTPNVKVHHHHDSANWRIEVEDPRAQPRPAVTRMLHRRRRLRDGD